MKNRIITTLLVIVCVLSLAACSGASETVTVPAELELTEEQRQQLDNIASDIEGRMNAKGNYSVRDTSGKIVGYEATFEMENYVDGIEEMTRGNSFDIKEWIRQNEGLFPDTQDHPGWESFEERFEKATKGLNDDYEW